MRLRKSHSILAVLLSIAVALPVLPASAANREENQIGGGTKSLYIMLIQQARTDGRPRAALAYLDDFDRQYPGELEARLLRINCLLDLGQVKQAAAYGAQLPANDHTGKADTIRGHILAAQQDWSGAIVQYQAALRASPADPLTLNALGFAQLESGDLNAAVEALKSASDLSPSNQVVRNNLLLALTMAGRTDEAAAKLRSIRDIQAQAQLRQQIADQSNRLSARLAGNAKGER